MDIGIRLWDMYCDWLLDRYADEIHTKEDLINATCENRHYDEFIEEVSREIKRNSEV